MATAVQIQIAVDPTDSAGKIGAVKGELEGLGNAGVSAGAKAGQGMQQMTGHVASGLDSVRLLSQEFGLRLPRAIEAMLSRMPAVTGALSGMIGVLGAVAAVEIFAHIGEAIYKAFDMGGERARALQKAIADTDLEMRRMSTDIDVQIDKLQEQQAKIEHKPFNGMKLALDEASQAADAMSQKLDAINQKFSQDVIGKIGGNWFQRNVSFSDSGGNTKYEQTMLEEHQKHLDEAPSPQDQLKEETSYANSLQTRLKELQDMRKTAPGSGVNYSNEIEATQRLQGQQKKEADFIAKGIDRDTTEAKVQKDRDAQAGIEKNKQLAAEAARQREEATKEIARLQAEASEAGVRDDALATQKRLDEIAQVEARLRELHATTAQIAEAEALINKKFDDAREKQIAQQIDQAQKALRDAQSAGLTGAPKLEAQRTARNEDIDATSEDPKAKALRHQAVEVEYNQEMARLQDENDKREAEQQQRQMERQQANQAEDLRYTQEATQAEARVRENGALGWVASYQNAVIEIEAQEQQRLAKLKEDATKEGLTYDEVAQRKMDIERSANAEIEQQNQRMQQQIAGTLESAFKDPVGTIKNQMEKLMFDILASWVMHLKSFQSIFGGIMGGITSGSAGGQGSGVAGGVMNSLLHGGASGVSSAGTNVSTGAGSSQVAQSPNSGGGSSIISGVANAPGVAGYFSGGSTNVGVPSAVSALSSDSSNNVSFDNQGNASYSGMIDSEAAPQYEAPEVALPHGVTAMGALSAAGAAYSAEQTTVGAFDQGNIGGVMSGTLGDTAAGATIGSVIPGIGTAVGAVVGAAVGFGSGLAGAVLGMGGRIAARDFYKKSVFPAIETERMGQGVDPMSAISDINRTALQGYDSMQQQWGASAADWVKANYMNKEVSLAISQISQHAAGGEQYTQRQAVQFHTGGYIGDFGDMGTSGNEGFIHALLGEAVMNTQAVAKHAPAINAMNDGASASDIAAMYLRGSSTSTAAAASSSDTHFHVHTLDTQTMTQWLRNGGARMISKAQNNLAGQYAGEGVIG